MSMSAIAARVAAALLTSEKGRKGVAFLLIYYTGRNLILYLPFKDMIRFWERAQNGGRKSFRFEEVDLSYQIEAGHGVFVPYLEAIQKDLDARD